MTEKSLLSHIQAISRRTGFERTGDDACVVGDRVLSTDQFIEGTHFTWQQMSPEKIGYKGAVQALSDLAAMASPAEGILCSAAWPAADTEKILAVFSGIESACIDYKIPLLGGDISSSRSLTYLDFSVIGKAVNPPNPKNAKAGYRLAVTGPIGSAQGGFYCTQEGKNFPRLLEAFQRPRAHIATACALNGHGAIAGLTDLSDSLSVGLHYFLRHCRLGARIDLEKIPIDAELRQLCSSENLDLKDFIFGGGEDYQLLMALTPSASENLISDHGLCVIGELISDAKVSYIDGQKIVELTEVGWDPFVL